MYIPAKCKLKYVITTSPPLVPQLCQRLGWKPKGRHGGHWEVLPIVLSANGYDPEWFELPEDLILLVPLLHPQ